MNPKTIINGKEYRFIKTVKELTTDRIAVLCEDEHGCFFICDAEMWQAARRNIKQRSINTPHRIKKSSCSNPYSSVGKMYTPSVFSIPKQAKAAMSLPALTSG